MKRSILWLASYPKSGNTWARIFLANYLSDAKKPLSINEMQRFGFGDSRPQSYVAAAGRPVDTTNPEVTVKLRGRMLANITANNADVNFVKTHNCRQREYGCDLIPPQLTRQAIYILRNPLDVAVSFARHYGLSHEKTVELMGQSGGANQADQNTTWVFLNSWSGHVNSWTKAAPFPVLILRYEDLLADPQTHFGKALKFIGFPVVPERLEKAVRFASFDELKKQEDEAGFVERSAYSDRFFVKGQAEQWRDELDPALVSRIRRDHKQMMKKYGYYDA